MYTRMAARKVDVIEIKTKALKWRSMVKSDQLRVVALVAMLGQNEGMGRKKSKMRVLRGGCAFC